MFFMILMVALLQIGIIVPGDDFQTDLQVLSSTATTRRFEIWHNAFKRTTVGPDFSRKILP